MPRTSLPSIAHLVDDTALGGVMRVVSVLDSSLGDVPQEMHRVTPLAPLSARRFEAATIVVHFTLSWAKLPYLAALRTLNPRARLVIVEHSYTAAFEAAMVPDRRRFRTMLRLGYRMADAVGAVSMGQAGWMGRAELLRGSKLSLVPCAVPPGDFASIALPVPGSPMRLGAFGRYHPQKGFDTLVRAMRDVPPEEATLSLAGYGEDETMLRKMASGLPHVSIGGRVDAAEFLSSVEVVAMPSRWEAGGVVCWETRHAGRPMIVADVDCLPEQVSPAWGSVVPSGDPAALSAAIRAMAGSDRCGMGAAARESSREGFGTALASWRTFLGV